MPAVKEQMSALFDPSIDFEKGRIWPPSNHIDFARIYNAIDKIRGNGNIASWAKAYSPSQAEEIKIQALPILRALKKNAHKYGDTSIYQCIRNAEALLTEAEVNDMEKYQILAAKVEAKENVVFRSRNLIAYDDDSGTEIGIAAIEMVAKNAINYASWELLKRRQKLEKYPDIFGLLFDVYNTGVARVDFKGDEVRASVRFSPFKDFNYTIFSV